MSSDRTVGGLRRWLQFGSGNPTGATQRGGEMGVTVTAGRACARRRISRAPPAARRKALCRPLASAVRPAGAVVCGLSLRCGPSYMYSRSVTDSALAMWNARPRASPPARDIPAPEAVQRREGTWTLSRKVGLLKVAPLYRPFRKAVSLDRRGRLKIGTAAIPP